MYSSIKSFAKKVLPQSIWTKLRIYKINRAVSSYTNQIVTHNYCGHELKVELKDALADGWYNKDWPNLHEIDFFKSKGILGNGTKIFDLGAHQGVVAMVFAKECSPEGRVLAVEANEHNFMCATGNRNLNKINDLHIVHGAVSDKEDVLYFNRGLNGAVDDGSARWGQVKTNSYSIDYLLNKYFIPDIIYLDIEGYEFIALKGAKQALDLDISWFIEVHGEETISNYGGSVQEVLSHFPSDKFDLFMAEDGKEFVPFDANNSMIKERFFFIAVKKKN